jgi:glycosyltransferase involved in cell wall biosynthesis
MRIGIDARSIHLGGIGRYIRELITNIANIDNENDYTIYFISESQAELNEIKKENVSSAILPVSIYDIHKQPLLSYRLRKDKLDLFHATSHWLSPFFSPCDLVITIHDLFNYYLPEVVTRKASLYGRILFPRTFNKAKWLMATTDFMKRELLKYYPQLAHKVSVIPLGVSDAFGLVSDDGVEKIKKKYDIKKKFVLYVGTLRNHKNVHRLLEAFSKLPSHLRNDYQLIIAAEEKARYSEIIKRPGELGIEELVQFVGFVQTDDLAVMYKAATVLVLPALCEWFGLPIIEAMACGTPVITSNITSMPEVAGGAALLVNPYNVDELKDAIERVITDESLRYKLSSMGRERAKLFSWTNMAREVLDVYKEIGKRGLVR